MGTLLSYSILSGFILLAMYGTYRLTLAGEKQHAYNRGILLAIYAVSFLTIPLTALVRHLLTPEPAVVPVVDIAPVATPIIQTIVATEPTPASSPSWGTVLIWVYLAGVVLLALHTAVTWLRILVLIAKGERIARTDHTLVLIDRPIAPFSWMHYIVMNRADYNSLSDSIIAHELRHIHLAHWADLIVAQLVIVINWFNPAAWLIRRELSLVHEYQADKAVIDQGYELKAYQLLLINKAVSPEIPALVNSINSNQLKKRIIMMYKETSGTGRRLKALALVPALALALAVSASPIVRDATGTIAASPMAVSSQTKKATKVKPSVVFNSLSNANYKPTVTLKAYNFGNNIGVSDVVYTTMGKSYNPTSISTSIKADTATIAIVLPYLTEWSNTTLSLKINGKKYDVDMERDEEPRHYGLIPEYPGARYMFNGVETPYSELRNINTANICISYIDKSVEPHIVHTAYTTIDDTREAKYYVDGTEISHRKVFKISGNQIASLTLRPNTNPLIIDFKLKPDAKLPADFYNPTPQLEIASFHRTDNKISVIINATNISDEDDIDDAVLVNPDDQVYHATSVTAKSTGATTSIVASFPNIRVFNGTQVAVSINGEMFTIKSAARARQRMEAASNKKLIYVYEDTVGGTKVQTVSDEVKYIVDGVEMPYDEVKKIDPSRIATTTVVPNTDPAVIEITLKSESKETK